MTGQTDMVLAVAKANGPRLDLPAANRTASNGTRPPADATVTTDTREDPGLWPEIRMIIETDIRTAPRELQREIGPSELGGTCVHCLAAKLAGWPERKSPAWLPFIGTCVHQHMEQLFEKLNDEPRYQFDMLSDDNTPELVERFRAEHRVKVGRIQGLYGGADITGSIDLWDRKTQATVDWKVVGTTTLTKVRAHGPSQQYRVQASLYGIGLENEGETVMRSCIYFLPRNKTSLDQAWPVELPFDPKPGRWALARAQLLANIMDVIEQADGPDMRDAWIRRLPADPDECFQCRACAWPDQTRLPEFDTDTSRLPPVKDKWLQLIPLIETHYTPSAPDGE